MPEHVAERLSKAADAINALDHEMSSVREWDYGCTEFVTDAV